MRNDAFEKYNTWGHSTALRLLYRQRCRREEPEMTCAAQAADIIADLARPGYSLLDVGCGSGYFYHSLQDRNIPVSYCGIDATPSLIEIGQQEMPKYGLPAENLKVMKLQDLNGSADLVLSMNFLTYLDNFHAPLERLLDIAKVGVILRESISDKACFAYVVDDHLDPGLTLSVHINTYRQTDITDLMTSRGFEVREFMDRRTKGQPEVFLEQPHYWKFLIATRAQSASREL